MDSYYDQIAPSYNELHGEEQKRKARIIVQNIEIKPSDRLLDVGCGTAPAAGLFKCEKTGIDPSAELLKHAKIPSVQGVAENLPFPDSSFDIVLCLTVIHNCNDVKKALNEMNRVTKKDAIISVLKKASNFKAIEDNIKSTFKVQKRLEEQHDSIFFLQKV